MKKVILLKFCFALLIYISTPSFAQTVINYNTWTGASNCNVFWNPGTTSHEVSVPVTINGINNNIAHITAIGQPVYDNTNKTINLDSRIVNGSTNHGTEYRATFNFKQYYTYVITVNAARIMAQQTGPNVLLRLDLNNGGSGTNSLCTGTDVIDASGSGGLKKSTQITSTAFLDYIFTFSSLAAAQSYLMVAAIPPAGSVQQTILIKKITIEETPPPVTFSVSPSTLPLTCGTTTPQTFTANNVYNTSGVTNYVWNLGSASNGWKLTNGSAAPQTNSTGAMNSLTLVPQCGATQSNVSVTATVTGQNYAGTNPCTVTVTKPSLSISGDNVICGYGAIPYSVTGAAIPCSSPVVWSASLAV